jgi:hypothetical protein
LCVGLYSSVTEENLITSFENRRVQTKATTRKQDSFLLVLMTFGLKVPVNGECRM